MKFNLKNLMLSFSIMTSISNNCINAMDKESINANSNIINANNNTINCVIYPTNTNTNNQEYVNINDLDEILTKYEIAY